MLLWIQLVLQMSLFTTCLALGMSVLSDFSVIKNMSASADVMIKYKAKSRIICGAQCRQQPDCIVASYNLTARECFILTQSDATYIEDDNSDILWLKIQCKRNWLQFTGSCYYFSKDKKSWTNAQDECKRTNSNLAKINDALENSWMYSIIKVNWTYLRNGFDIDDADELYVGYKSDYVPSNCDIHQWGTWIGATDNNAEGNWVWVSDNTTTEYTPWFDLQPDNGGGAQNCAIVNSWFNYIQKSTEYFWDDDNCWALSYFVCEAEMRSPK